MAKYTGAKHRLARREGVNIFEKEGASLARRLTVPPGVHGPKGSRRKNSEYALQLREKQKVKRTYGLLEKQFKRYYEKGGINLFSLLERRLDNAVYRLGLVPSRLMGRQLVSHGHVLVNGRKVTLPSYSLRVDEIITFSPKALEMPVVQKMLEITEPKVIDYYERKAAVGRLTQIPVREQIPVEANDQLIIEYYSR